MEKVKQNIIVTFVELDYDNAPQDILDDYKNVTKTFTDALGYQAGNNWLAIIESNGDTVVYPSARIYEVKIINKE